MVDVLERYQGFEEESIILADRAAKMGKWFPSANKKAKTRFRKRKRRGQQKQPKLFKERVFFYG